MSTYVEFTPPSTGAHTEFTPPIGVVEFTPPSTGAHTEFTPDRPSSLHIGSLRFGSTGPGW